MRLQPSTLPQLPDQRRIQVRMTQENRLLFIRFENSYEYALYQDCSRFATTKARETEHGYGPKGIRYAAMSEMDEGKKASCLHSDKTV